MGKLEIWLRDEDIPVSLRAVNMSAIEKSVSEVVTQGVSKDEYIEFRCEDCRLSIFDMEQVNASISFYLCERIYCPILAYLIELLTDLAKRKKRKPLDE